MIYMTSEEWNKINNLIELRHFYDLAEELRNNVQLIADDVAAANPKTVNTDTGTYESNVAILADKLEQQKHLLAWRFSHKRDHQMDIDPLWCGNWKDARLLAVEAFKLAGYDTDKFNFDVKATTNGGFIVIITLKERT